MAYRPEQATSDFDDDLEFYGLSIDDIPDELISNNQQQSFEIFPENANAVYLFTICSTQFQQTKYGITGLNYTAVESAIRLSGMKFPPEDFHRLRVLETAAVNEFNLRMRRI